MSVRTWKEIKWKGIECKKNVEQNYKLGIWEQWGYYMAKAIITPYKDIKRNKSLGEAPHPTGDKIKFNIPKADYIQLAKNLIKFCEKNNRMPSYLNYKNKRIRCRLYVYLFAQALAYFNEHKKLPDTITINYKAFYPPTPKKEYKKYGHSTEHGCNNMGQNNSYYCGCHSLQEVFRNLTGKVISQSTIAEVAGTTEDGTDHDGLNTCVAWFNRKYGYNLKVEWKNFSELGWNGIRKIIDSNNQDCIIHNNYRNQWGHYEVVNKVYDDSILVQNSLGDYGCGDCYCGYVEDRSPSEYRSYINGISQKSIMVITNES
jgi:hypothetical protein